MALKFTVNHAPVARPRQKVRIMWPKGAASMSFQSLRKLSRATTYTPADHPVHAFKAAVRSAGLATGAQMTTDPVRVDLVLVFARPLALMWKRKPMTRIRHAKKPDRDNTEKSVTDALEGVLWKNDSQVCDGIVEKWIAAGDEEPHVEITVRRLRTE